MLPPAKNYTFGCVSGEAICAPTPPPGSPRRTPRGSSASPETAKPPKMPRHGSDMARRPRRAGRGGGLKGEAAKEELRLRQPRTMGELALLARKQGDVQLLKELQQASTSFPALPGPTPLLALDNGALAVGQASTIDAGLDVKVGWIEVSHRLARRDIAPLAKCCFAVVAF